MYCAYNLLNIQEIVGKKKKLKLKILTNPVHHEKAIMRGKIHICQYLILIIYLIGISGQTDSVTTRCTMSVLII